MKSVLAEQRSSFPAPKSAGNILVVDDDTFFATLMSETLRHANYTVRVARDARRALNELVVEKFDCLVTDLNMPHESGLWLIEQARRECPDMGIVIVSGSEPLRSHRSDPSWSVLEKPFRGTELLDVVGASLGPDRS